MLDFFSNPLGEQSAGFELHDTGTVEELLESELALASASPVHLAVRGTAEPDSVRCEWRGVARTPEQREEAIRFWLDLDDSEGLPSAQEVERLFMEKLDQGNPVYPETVRANFRAIARGGVSTEYLFLTCFTDYVVQEFLLGSGPSATTTLQLAYDRQGEARSYDLYVRTVH